MKFDPNDPKWTAYVLGELGDKERAAVEAMMSENPEARTCVEEIRALAGMLEEELQTEPCPALDDARRAAIHEKLDAGGSATSGNATSGNGAKAPVARLVSHPGFRVAMAACAVFAVTLGVVAAAWFLQQGERLGAKQGVMAPVDAGYAATAPDPAATTASSPSPETLSRETMDHLSALGYVNNSVEARRVYQARTPDLPRTELELQEIESTSMWAGAKYNFEAKKKTEAFVGTIHALPEANPATRASTRYVLDFDTEVDRDVYLKLDAAGYGEQSARFNTEAYDRIVENEFLAVTANPVSTFSIDVDTASYANARRFLTQGQLPPPGSVRLEEMINYFTYSYPEPDPGVPFSVTLEAAACPWNLDHRLVRVGLKGRELPPAERPPMNLVFLLDVSGSMRPANKLPLVKKSMKMLTERLDGNDRVAIAVYAGASGLVLPSTTANNQATVLAGLERLQAGGSTNGGQGIELAYNIARENFVEEGVNRVILCTDGDFNVGVTDQDSLVRLVENKAKTGIGLTVMGFGMGNLKDSTLEKLADKGDGNYGYIDTLAEAQKVFVEQLTGTLVTIAKDVKIQVEFNSREVESYRLLGYENRLLAREDFNDDTKDAGEIGAGHTVTALYEVVPAGVATASARKEVDPLRYQERGEASSAAFTGEMLHLRLRYKEPESGNRTTEEVYTDVNGNGMYDEGEPYVDGNQNGRHDGAVIASELIEVPLVDRGLRYAQASPDFKFAASVAAFGMILRDSSFKGMANLDGVLELGAEGVGADPTGRRAEFLDLVRRAQQLGKR